MGGAAGQVVRLIAWQGLAVAGTGLLLGTAGALALARLIQGQLYGVSAADPATYAAVAAGLALVAGLATYVPARRATRVDPVMALRAE
jgi:putative ABC transport system permease protein